MNKKVLFVIVMALVMTTACGVVFPAEPTATTVPQVNAPTAISVSPTATKIPVTATSAPTSAPTALPTKAPTVASANNVPSKTTTLYSQSCTYLNWQVNSAKYRVDPNEYRIPIADLKALAGSNLPGLILFEGEDSGVPSEHHVATVYADGGTVTSKGALNATFQFRQGSFWACRQDSKGISQDQILGESAWKKWRNWSDQNIKGDIVVYLTDGTRQFLKGSEPSLVDTKKVASGYRNCDVLTEPVEVTPYALTQNSTNGTVVGAPGASNCRTLFVGKHSPNLSFVAQFFAGARDNFEYVDASAKFYLIPTAWGANDMQSFVDKAYLGQGLKVAQLQ